MTAEPAPARMDADAFLDWAVRTEADAELHDGWVVWNASERAAHGRAKAEAFLALREAARRSGRCVAFVDSLSIRASDRDVFIPDAVLICGERIGGEIVAVEDAVVLAEIASDDSARRDAGRKMAFYARLPSFRAYLLVYPEERRVVAHLRRPGAEALETWLYGAEETPPPLRLDPPGIALDLAPLLATF